MIPAKITGSNERLNAAIDGGGAHLLPLHVMSDGDGFHMSAWEPTPDELDRLRSGAKVYLAVWGERHPDGVAVQVGDEPELEDDQ